MPRAAELRAILALACAVAQASGLICPENSAGAGGGNLCTCAEGYEGRIIYNDDSIPPSYGGSCRLVEQDYFLGVGTGFFLAVVMLSLSLIFFTVAGKTSFECSTCGGAPPLTVLMLRAPPSGACGIH